MKDLNKINDKTDEGKMLMAALALITMRLRTNKTPNKVLGELEEIRDTMYRKNEEI